MGWEDVHLHQFKIFGKTYGASRLYGIPFTDDGRLVRLADFRFRAGERFVYEYDMGDLWQHDLRLERIAPLDLTKHYPLCTAGAGACPPEDCGGPPGYRRWQAARCSLETLELARADILLVAERVQAFLQGGPRPTEDDMDFVDALERLEERIDDEPPKFERRTINRALDSLRKDRP